MDAGALEASVEEGSHFSLSFGNSSHDDGMWRTGRMCHGIWSMCRASLLCVCVGLLSCVNPLVSQQVGFVAEGLLTRAACKRLLPRMNDLMNSEF